jgi:hypothetical protein
MFENRETHGFTIPVDPLSKQNELFQKFLMAFSQQRSLLDPLNLIPVGAHWSNRTSDDCPKKAPMSKARCSCLPSSGTLYMTST